MTDNVRAAAERVRRALAALAECMKPHDAPDGDWSAKPDADGVFWHLLGPRYVTRPARTVIGTVELDSFPGELPTRAERVANALVTLVNDAGKLLPPADDAEPVRDWGAVSDPLGTMRVRWSPEQLWIEVGGYSCPVKDDPRLGDVRRLCKALGVPLTEGK